MAGFPLSIGQKLVYFFLQRTDFGRKLSCIWKINRTYTDEPFWYTCLPSVKTKLLHKSYRGNKETHQ